MRTNIEISLIIKTCGIIHTIKPDFIKSNGDFCGDFGDFSKSSYPNIIAINLCVYCMCHWFWLQLVIVYFINGILARGYKYILYMSYMSFLEINASHISFSTIMSDRIHKIKNIL